MDITTILNTYNSKINFMKGIICFAKVDGVVDQKEQQFFINAMNALNIKEHDLQILSSELLSADFDDNINFENKKQSLFFLKEAIQLCYCNDDYSVKEKELMAIFGEKLNISKESLDSIEKWALEGYNWSKKGEELLEMEE